MLDYSINREGPGRMVIEADADVIDALVGMAPTSGLVVNCPRDDSDNVLPHPTTNWSDLASPALRNSEGPPSTPGTLEKFSASELRKYEADCRMAREAGEEVPAPEEWLARYQAGQHPLSRQPAANQQDDSDNVLPVPIADWGRPASQR